MKRRGNKSNKVPNVKLRPPQASASASARAREIPFLAQDSQACDDTGISPADNCPRPFRGLVICATGASLDKTALFKQASDLGAMYISVFTDKVTHLIASDHGGAKYNCALERKIPILLPSWLSSSHETWLRGDDVDLPQSLTTHRLPIFSGVTISVSNIPLTTRTKINKLLTLRGGTYLKDLTRPVKITHLLCGSEGGEEGEESDKMKYARKFNERGEAVPPIKLVWEEWFWDCVEGGGRFDEGGYGVDGKRPQRRVWEETTPSSPPPASPLPPPAPIPAPAPRQEAEEEEDLPASLKRPPAVTLQLWESLLKPRGFEVSGGRLVRSHSKKGKEKELERTYTEEALAPDTGGGRSFLSSLKRGESFVSPTEEVVGGPSNRPFRRTATIPALPPQPTPPPPTGLFASIKFRLLGEADTPSVRDAILSAGGTIPPPHASSVDYIIVRLVGGTKHLTTTPPTDHPKFRTESWLEQTLHHSLLLPYHLTPLTRLTYIPLPLALNPILPLLPGAGEIKVSLSGFGEAEAVGARRLCRALGIEVMSVFRRGGTTHLVVNEGVATDDGVEGGRKEKRDKAKEWGVPIVGMRWVERCVRAGMVVPAEGGEGGEAMDVDLIPQEDESQTMETGNAGSPLPPSSLPLPSTNPQPQPLAARPTIQVEYVSGLSSFPDQSYFLPSATSSSASLLPANSSLPHSLGGGRRPTYQQINEEMRVTRIPSSKSPSPMKSSQPQPARGQPLTRANSTTSPGVKALQESITSLLGKRTTSGREDSLPVPEGGKVKKPRPLPRSRSRKDASVPPAPASADGSSLPLGGGIFPPLESFDDELNLRDGQADSERVVYVDPEGEEERGRLERMFGVPVTGVSQQSGVSAVAVSAKGGKARKGRSGGS